MINTIKATFFQPLLFLFEYRIKRLISFIALFLVALILVVANIYVSNISFSLLKQEAAIDNEISDDAVTNVIVQKGDTLNKILKTEGISDNDIQKITKLANVHNLTSLKIGQSISFEYDITLIEDDDQDLTTEQKILSKISFEKNEFDSIDIVRAENGFLTKETTIPLTKVLTKYETTVDSSVISSLKKAGLSVNSIVSLINTYSHQIDFQRQIQPGDKITVLTEKFVTPDSKFSHHGDIIYASIETGGAEYKIYKYSPDGRKENYQFFSHDGQSTKGTLLKTPVKVVRISSKYGKRDSHPIHGYSTMHCGVDFSAPTGTPIYAAGNGIVEFAGWKSGYGRMVVIKHGNGLSTAYAHASKFANNLRKGSIVKQGETIAFVGTSGNVTGAHLHYEVRVNGRHVNPSKFKSTPNIQLSGKELSKFNNFKHRVTKLASKLDGDIELAAKEVKDINLF